MTQGHRSNSADPREPKRQAQRSELLQLYEIAVEEYRFQVRLNWERAQYLLGFNTAVIAVGAGLIKLGGSRRAAPLVAGIFVVGFVAAVMSACATYLQHGYYRAARDQMRALGEQLALGSAAVTTTPGMRGALPRRLGKVQSILYTLLAVTATVDLVGIYYVLVG